MVFPGLSYRVFLQVHRFSERLRVFTLEDEVQQLLTAPPPGVGVVGVGSVSQLPLHWLPTLRDSQCEKCWISGRF